MSEYKGEIMLLKFVPNVTNGNSTNLGRKKMLWIRRKADLNYTSNPFL